MEPSYGSELISARAQQALDDSTRRQGAKMDGRLAMIDRALLVRFGLI